MFYMIFKKCILITSWVKLKTCSYSYQCILIVSHTQVPTLNLHDFDIHKINGCLEVTKVSVLLFMYMLQHCREWCTENTARGVGASGKYSTRRTRVDGALTHLLFLCGRIISVIL